MKLEGEKDGSGSFKILLKSYGSKSFWYIFPSRLDPANAMKKIGENTNSKTQAFFVTVNHIHKFWKKIPMCSIAVSNSCIYLYPGLDYILIEDGRFGRVGPNPTFEKFSYGLPKFELDALEVEENGKQRTRKKGSRFFFSSMVSKWKLAWMILMPIEHCDQTQRALVWFLVSSISSPRGKIYKALLTNILFQAEHALYTPGLDENRGSSDFVRDIWIRYKLQCTKFCTRQ